MTNMQAQTLLSRVNSLLEASGNAVASHEITFGELTLDVDAAQIKATCQKLRDDFGFEQLTDLCGMDYSEYGAEAGGTAWTGERYGVVYHLISYQHNQRIRLRAQLPESNPSIDSVTEIWAGANWFEREAFDLFGIMFHGHDDLRRILTDYGFIGHPFRKDFPLSGQVEMRYDEEQGRVVYQPVTIDPRVLVPRTIRKDVFAKSKSEASTEAAAEEGA